MVNEEFMCSSYSQISQNSTSRARATHFNFTLTFSGIYSFCVHLYWLPGYWLLVSDSHVSVKGHVVICSYLQLHIILLILYFFFRPYICVRSYSFTNDFNNVYTNMLHLFIFRRKSDKLSKCHEIAGLNFRKTFQSVHVRAGDCVSSGGGGGKNFVDFTQFSSGVHFPSELKIRGRGALRFQ